jgi:uncharacterized Zn-binding protein involved in type VI secretion
MKPAACIFDKTTHGGIILPPAGPRTVMIGGLPAARMGDQQACPMVDGLKPHVGGVIAGGSTTVLINGLPAARAGDKVLCVGPPAKIVAVRNVLIG